MRIVVQATNQPVVDPVFDAQQIQAFQDGRKKIFGCRIQAVLIQRRSGNNLLIAFFFGIQNPQRIAFQAVFAVFGQLIIVRLQIGNQFFPISGTAFGIAERIDFYRYISLKPQTFDKFIGHGNNFNIGLRGFNAQEFDPKLGKLALAPLLRTFITEHRPGVI